MIRRKGDIFLHSLTQRSGTNFVIEIIKCHPQVSPSSKRIWEFPHLQYCEYLVQYNQKVGCFPKVLDVGETEILPYFGDALLTFLTSDIPPGQRLILKSPSVQNLKYFFSFFPESYLVILVRDGRDVACSAMKTAFAAPPRFRISKPGTFRFAFTPPLKVLARRWSEASRETIDFLDSIKKTQWDHRTLVIRYEDLVGRSTEKIESLLDFLQLDKNSYNQEALSSIGLRGSSFHSNNEGKLNWGYKDIASHEFQPVGRWKSWSEKEQQIFLSEAEESLRHWGYIT